MLVALQSTRRAVARTAKYAPNFARRALSTDGGADIVLNGEPVGPFQMNMFLVGCKKSGTAALVDSGATADEMTHFQHVLEENNLTVTHLLQTHAHIDHVLGLSVSRKLWPDAPIYLHEKDMPVYHNAATSAASYGIPMPGPLPEDNIVHINEGDVINIGESISLNVLFTPGHCPGHVCYHDAKHKFLLGGDLIFAGSIGRTDLPLCNDQDMQASLRRVAKDIPGDTAIFPGHMQTTTMDHELATNPFLQFAE